MIFNNSTSEQCKSKFKMQFSYPNSKFRKEIKQTSSWQLIISNKYNSIRHFEKAKKLKLAAYHFQ